MSALKALKKLKKNKPQVISQSLAQLNNLKRSSLVKKDNKATNLQLKNDLKKLSNDVVLSMVSELSGPLNPLLSWFETAQSQFSFTPQLQPQVAKQSNQGQAINIKTISTSNSLLKQPLKSPACKRCPALQGGICKCAKKRFA